MSNNSNIMSEDEEVQKFKNWVCDICNNNTCRLCYIHSVAMQRLHELELQKQQLQQELELI